MYIYICDGDYITDVIIKIDGEYRTAHMKHRETVPSRHNNLVCVCVCVIFACPLFFLPLPLDALPVSPRRTARKLCSERRTKEWKGGKTLLMPGVSETRESS